MGKAKNNGQVMPRFYKKTLEETLISIEEELINFDWSIPELADHAGLSKTTVYNFKNKKTRFPQYMTIVKLSKAVGLNIILSR